MKHKALTLLATYCLIVFFVGCIGGPAISKKNMGNLELEIATPEGLQPRNVKIYVDGLYVGNISERLPVLYLKRGKRVIRAELPGAKPFEQSLTILGDPNHQVLDITFEKNVTSADASK